MKARFSDYDPTPTINYPDASQVKPRAPVSIILFSLDLDLRK
jgi:hypothetical protein